MLAKSNEMKAERLAKSYASVVDADASKLRAVRAVLDKD